MICDTFCQRTRVSRPITCILYVEPTYILDRKRSRKLANHTLCNQALLLPTKNSIKGLKCRSIIKLEVPLQCVHIIRVLPTNISTQLNICLEICSIIS